MTTAILSSSKSSLSHIVGGSLFFALLAQCAIPLPFTPVPLTLHTVALFLLSYTLGRKKACLAILLYLLEGALGLPVFAQFHSGVATLLGVRGGYLFGFLLSAYVMSSLLEKRRSLPYLLSTFLIGSFLTLSLGTFWLSLFIGWNKAFLLGFLPFILPEITKAIFTSLYAVKKLIKS